MSQAIAPGGRGQPEFSVVVPVKNKASFLPSCLGSVAAAVAAHPGVELVVVDNGSSDGSREIAERICGDVGRVYLYPDLTIGAVRNAGAALTTGETLVFLDCDCIVPIDYLARARRVLDDRDISATGARVAYPDDGPWVESVWHRMHARVEDAFVPYINSANVIVRRSAFDAAGGFDPHLVTGEDAELGMRLNAGGFRVFNAAALTVLHVDNPKTLRAFFGKEVWHALGMFGTMRISWLDRPTIMMFTHLVLVVVAGVQLFVGPGPLAARLLVGLGLFAVVPGAAVAYRARQRSTRVPILPALVLYEVYFFARLAALWQIVRRRLTRSP